MNKITFILVFFLYICYLTNAISFYFCEKSESNNIKYYNMKTTGCESGFKSKGYINDYSFGNYGNSGVKIDVGGFDCNFYFGNSLTNMYNPL